MRFGVQKGKSDRGCGRTSIGRSAGAVLGGFLIATGLLAAGIPSAEAATLTQAIELAFVSNAAALERKLIENPPLAAAGKQDVDDARAGPVDTNSVNADSAGAGLERAPVVEAPPISMVVAPVSREATEFLAFDVVEAYLQVLRARESVALATANLQVQETILEAVRSDSNPDRAESTSSETDEAQSDEAGSLQGTQIWRQAELRVNQAQSALKHEQERLSDAEADYARLVGQRPGELAPPELPLEGLPADVEAAVALARRNNLAEKMVGLSFRNAGQESDLDEELQDSEEEAGVDVLPNLPLLEERKVPGVDSVLLTDGGDQPTLSGSLPQVNEPTTRHLRSPEEAERAMRSAWFALEASRQSVADLKSAVAFARETRADYGREFVAAERNVLDLLDAEMELFVSASELSSAETNAALAGYRILAVGGTLLSSLGVSTPAGIGSGQGAWKSGLLD